MKNLVYALGIASSALVAGNSYSQNYVKTENVEKNYRELDKPAKELPSILAYTNPTSIHFDSLDETTKKRVWSILSNHYELQLEQYENKLKDYENCQKDNSKLKEEKTKLIQDSKILQDTLKKCSEILRDNDLLPKEESKKK